MSVGTCLVEGGGFGGVVGVYNRGGVDLNSVVGSVVVGSIAIAIFIGPHVQDGTTRIDLPYLAQSNSSADASS